MTGCLATSNTCQTKSRAVRGRGAATIRRPSFTNYAEYLLTGGLSPRVLSRPHPLHPRHPITSRSARLRAYRGLQRGSCSSARLEVQAAKTKGKGARRRGKVGARALIWETFQKKMMKRLSEFR